MKKTIQQHSERTNKHKAGLFVILVAPKLAY